MTRDPGPETGRREQLTRGELVADGAPVPFREGNRHRAIAHRGRVVALELLVDDADRWTVAPLYTSPEHAR